MKALSIKQPWAWLIVRGLKDIENRQWLTNYRGDILIHASKTYDDRFDTAWAESIIKADMPPVSFFDQLRGGIVGAATITDCVRSHPSPWFFGPQGFVLDKATPLPFFPCRGFPGIFDTEYMGAAA